MTTGEVDGGGGETGGAARMGPSAFARFKNGFFLPWALWTQVRERPNDARAYVRLTFSRCVAALAGAVVLYPVSSAFEWLAPKFGWDSAFTRVLASLIVAQGLVVAFTRDHQDTVSAKVARACGLLPEDEPSPPRMRIEWPWVRRKLGRKLRGSLLLGVGAALVGVLSLVLRIAVEVPAGIIGGTRLDEDALEETLDAGLGVALQSPLVALWALYWFAVASLAKTSFAFADLERADPAYARALRVASERAPRTLAWAPRLLGRLIQRIAGDLRGPAAMLDSCLPEGLGFAVFRTITAVPLVALAVRPLVPVAAQSLVRRVQPTRTAACAHVGTSAAQNAEGALRGSDLG